MSFRPVWPASTVGSRPAWTTDSVRLFSIIKSRRRKFRLSQISAASGPHPPQGSVHPLLPEPARLAWREPPRETRGAPTPRPCGLDGRGRMDRTTCAPGAGGTGRPGLAPCRGRGRHLGTSHLPLAGGVSKRRGGVWPRTATVRSPGAGPGRRRRSAPADGGTESAGRPHPPATSTRFPLPLCPSAPSGWKRLPGPSPLAQEPPCWALIPPRPTRVRLVTRLRGPGNDEAPPPSLHHFPPAAPARAQCL